MEANYRPELGGETINFITTKALLLLLLQPPQGSLRITLVDEMSASSALKEINNIPGKCQWNFFPFSSCLQLPGTVGFTFYLGSEQMCVKPDCCWLLCSWGRGLCLAAAVCHIGQIFVA